MNIAWLIKAVFGVFDSKYVTKEEKNVRIQATLLKLTL